MAEEGGEGEGGGGGEERRLIDLRLASPQVKRVVWLKVKELYTKRLLERRSALTF